MTNLSDILSQGMALAGADGLAVHDGLLSMTYEELSDTVYRFSGYLVALNIKPGDRVGLWVDKSCRALAAMLAITHVGAVYVPIDPANPIRRVDQIRKDCQLSALVTSLEKLEQCNKEIILNCEIILLNDEDYLANKYLPKLSNWTEVMAAAILIEPVRVKPNELAYVLYTSGSTGTPKGVKITHFNALAFISWACETLSLSQQDRFANHAPWHFDLSVFDIYVSLLNGASVHLISELLSYVPQQLVEFIEKRQITIWYSVPTALKRMLDAEPDFSSRCSSLKTVIFAGEAFEVKALKVLRSQLESARLYNFYGPTETNVCTYYEVTDTVPELLPIGYPASFDTVTVRDPDGEELAQGLRGAICVSGPTVFRGYWGQPELIGEHYNTGDLGYYNKEGQLIYNGREDHMVKVNGYRIHLGEVEYAINQHENVSECVVVVNEAKQLHAHITIEGRVPSLLELKIYCSKLLPKYMLIEQLRIWEQLPLTRNGKYARKDLLLDKT